LIDKQVGDVPAALRGLQSGASLMIGGFGNAGLPANLVRALAPMELTGLTLIINAIRRIDECDAALFDERRISHVITTAFRGPGAAAANFEAQWLRGEVSLEIVPQGTFAERIRAGGAGIPAFYTPTAAGTSLADGREQRLFQGRSCVLEEALRADFALLRAQKADRFGNLSFRGTQANFGPAMAAAADITVVEVEEISARPLPPEQIHLPGIYVDRVLQAPRLD
jgi:3-oxoacid CoA-transferase A subunit